MIRNALESEFEAIGKLMVSVYSRLEGFPSPEEQPDYYRLLSNVGELTRKPGTELLVSVTDGGEISGAVVYFSNMKNYGSGGTATLEQNTSGFRLLSVDQSMRGKGIGKLLTYECIRKAREKGHANVVIHTTKAMQTAWSMYEKIGFKRAEDLDFMQGNLPVYGFRLKLGDMEKGKGLIRVYTGTENNAILLKERLEEAGISAIIKNDSEDAFFLIAPQVVDLYIQEEDKHTAEMIIRDFVLTNPAK